MQIKRFYQALILVIWIKIPVIYVFWSHKSVFGQRENWLGNHAVLSYIPEDIEHRFRPKSPTTTMEISTKTSSFASALPPLTTASNAIKNTKSPKSLDKQKKKILLWGPFWGDPIWEVGLGSAPFERLQCAVKNCEIINDKSQLDAADAVLFHAHEIIYPPPPRRRSRQVWVFFMLESPAYSLLTHFLTYTNEQWNNQFNWTMTYRRDSDIQIPYGSVVQIDENTKSRKNSTEPRHSIKKPKRLVAYIASNCAKVQSRRQEYVAQLEKYIPVDKYGACGNLTCNKDWGRGDPACMQMISNNYKFYLSFENSLCEDYVTEKLFKILPLDVVPVVRGGANYRYDA